MIDRLIDSALRTIARAVAEAKQEWRRERELSEAQHRETIATLKAEVLELRNELQEMGRTIAARAEEALTVAERTLPEIAQEYVKSIPQPLSGRDGEPGAPGEPGQPGAPGEPGKDGRDGIDGNDGAPGVNGKDGAPGKFSAPKSWEPGAVYYEGDLVFYKGSTYCAQHDTAKDLSHDDWAPVALRGADGMGLVVRGTFNSDADYAANDIVALNGGSFVAKRDNPGPCPGDGWQLFASKGARGDRGERGIRGERGVDGKNGASFIEVRCDGDTLALVRDDGEIVTCDISAIHDVIRRMM